MRPRRARPPGPHNHALADQGRVIQLLDGDEEGVEINVDDRPLHHASGGNRVQSSTRVGAACPGLAAA